MCHLHVYYVIPLCDYVICCVLITSLHCVLCTHYIITLHRLLCAQVVCHQQLALYCKGHATSFSARVLTVDSIGKCMWWALNEGMHVYFLSLKIKLLCLFVSTSGRVNMVFSGPGGVASNSPQTEKRYDILTYPNI